MQSRKVYKSINTLVILLISVCLVVATTVIGSVLIDHSERSLKEVLWNHMLSVANTAAQMIDGDDVRLITEADTPLLDENGRRVRDGSERCSRIESVLIRVKNAQKDMYIPYIYVVRYENGRFVFVVDPELENPGKYGQEVVYTPSQTAAWAGMAMVDEEPYTDEWGTFYSAWSPITDSAGRIVGLAVVDFEAKQIADQTNYETRLIVICALILLAFSMAVVLFYSARTRRRFRELDDEIDELSGYLGILFTEIDGIEDKSGGDPVAERTGRDYLDYVQAKTKAMAQRLRDHIAYMQQQANVDFLTKVGNVRALSQRKEELAAAIEDRTADFAVGVFDIDRLKMINDRFGHECGDAIIRSAADALRKAFAGHDVFRIGGDEFAVVFTGVTEKQIELLFQLLDQQIERINVARDPAVPPLSLSKGCSFYDPAADSSFRDVFVRADQRMYAVKASAHSALDGSCP